jgi:hypothetical protein
VTDEMIIVKIFFIRKIKNIWSYCQLENIINIINKI